MGRANGAQGRPGGPDVGDIARLWNTITTELVVDAHIDIIPVMGGGAGPFLSVRVMSLRYSDREPKGYMHIWAAKTFSSTGYYITWGTLFDLLIVAYREMQRVLGDTDPSPAQPIGD